MNTHRGHPPELQPQPRRGPGRLGVEVLDDFHVIADETDGSHHHAPYPTSSEVFEMIVDVGLEPGHLRWSRP